VRLSIKFRRAGDAGGGRGKRVAIKWKIALFAAGGLVALLILAAAALVLFVDVNAHKPRLEADASEALGMDVRIGGRLGIGFFPGFHVTLGDVRIRNRGLDVASAKEATLGIELLPLLRKKELRIVKIGIKRPRISIEQDRDGRFNFEKPQGEGGKKTADEAKGMHLELDVEKISLSDGALFYADKRSGTDLEAGDFNLDVSRLRLSGGESPGLLKRLSFAAEFSCKALRKGTLAVSYLKIHIEGRTASSISIRLRCASSEGKGRGASVRTSRAQSPFTKSDSPCRNSASRSFSRPCHPRRSRKGRWTFPPPCRCGERPQTR
jgi:hypothetical protein